MIMKDAIKRDPVCRPYFVSMSDIASQIIRGDGFLEKLVTHRLVVIDDLDKVPQDKAWIKAQIFSLFDALVNERVAIIAATNAPGIETIAETFDRAVTSRIMSACEFVQFPSGLRCDYRIKNIKKC
jgi:DNA replication protein DnaC